MRDDMKDFLLPIFFFIAPAAIVVCVAACEPAGTSDDEREMADEIGTLIRQGGLKYVQDPSTSQCFAYGFVERGFGKTATGGPIVTWVPCDSLQVEAK